jgi:hypothetical protein
MLRYRNVEMLEVFVLEFRRLVLASFVESKEMKLSKCLASRVPKLTKLLTGPHACASQPLQSRKTCMIGGGLDVRNAVARIGQLVAASEMAPTPARVLESSDSSNNYCEAEATRKNKKQTAAVVTMNE